MSKPKASYETLEALAMAVSECDDVSPGMLPPLIRTRLSALRAETTPKLRTRAEVDAEIADAVRRNGPLPHTQHGAVWEIRGAFPERLMALCAEPTATEGERPVLECSRCGISSRLESSVSVRWDEGPRCNDCARKHPVVHCTT